jgi:hypothetical protein
LAEDIDLSKYISFDEEGDFVYDETEIENAIIDSVYNNYISSFEEIDIYKSLKVRDFSELLYDA